MEPAPDAAPPVTGLRHLDRVLALLPRLRSDGTARDTAGNRRLFYDQYFGLLLLSFFNPTLTSLRALQQASGLDAIRRRLGLSGQVSLGSLSEAGGVFDPDLLRGLLAQLAAQVAPAALPADREALRQLTAVDGTLLPVLPRMAHALWADAGRLSAKLHLQFEVARGLPVDATVTPAASSEIAQLKGALQGGRVYVTDRGYASYRLLADILAAGSGFVARLRADAAFRGQERPLTAEGRAGGVVRDVTVDRLGVGPDVLGRAIRVVVVHPDGERAGELILCTDRLDWPAEVVALAYRWRWQIELFFRWLKCVLGCRHLVSHHPDGIAIQVYVGLIASVLLSEASGRMPTKRTFEMLCHLASGWATADEVEQRLAGLKAKRAPPRNS